MRLRHIVTLLGFAIAATSQAQFNLSLNKSTVSGQNYVQGTITLDSIPPVNTTVITYDDSSLVSTPPSVIVYAGTLSRVFGIQTTAITSTVVVTIYAKKNFVVKSKQLTLAPLIPIAMVFNPNPVVGGQSLTCRLVVNGVAGPGGRTVSVYDNSPFCDVPSSVVIPAGATDTTFLIATRNVPTQKTILVTARVTAGATQGTFRINPGPPMDDRIVFRSIRDGNYEIYSMNPDGSDVVRLTNNTNDDDSPAWSPDRSRIAFSNNSYGSFPKYYKIYTMDANGGGTLQNSPNGDFNDYFPEWSPSTGVSFVTNMHGNGNLEIYLGGTRLTNSQGNDTHHSWSPDGTKIVFSSQRNINQELWIMNADGTNPIQLTFADKNYQYPSWSPDGSKIAFSGSSDTSQEIFTIRPDGSDFLRLTNNTEVDANPCWSPDGTRIAFHSGRSGNFEIYTMNANGTNQVNISNTTADDFSPSW